MRVGVGMSGVNHAAVLGFACASLTKEGVFFLLRRYD